MRKEPPFWGQESWFNQLIGRFQSSSPAIYDVSVLLFSLNKKHILYSNDIISRALWKKSTSRELAHFGYHILKAIFQHISTIAFRKMFLPNITFHIWLTHLKKTHISENFIFKKISHFRPNITFCTRAYILCKISLFGHISHFRMFMITGNFHKTFNILDQKLRLTFNIIP